MPKLTRRAARASLVLLVAVGVSSCGGGGRGSGPAPPPPAPPPNNAPTASNDVMRADDTTLSSIKVLANDTDADGDALSVTIEQPALVGTAVVNPDGSVRLDGLPAGFKGVSTFTYRVTDPEGSSAVAAAAIFVGADPFRVLFAGDPQHSDQPEVYVTDFVSEPERITAATESTLRLQGFAAAGDASTVVYRRADPAVAGTSQLLFVRPGDGAEPVPITLPANTTLVQNAQGRDQYAVSPDGQWIVFVVQDLASATSAYYLNVTSPTVLNKVNIPGAAYVTLPRFSSNSQSLYVLASGAVNGTGKSLYMVALGSGMVAQVSASAQEPGDDVIDYSVAPDQTRILLRANRHGSVGLYYVDSVHLQTEWQVSQTLPAGSTLLESVTSARLQRVAYTVQSASGFSASVAEISTTPNARPFGMTGARVLGFRPDEAAVLYSRGGLVYEAGIDSGTSDTLVGGGASAWYDSTGNIVLLEQFLPSGGTPPSYPALAVALRGSFGTTQPLGTSVLAARYINVSGFDRGVVFVGEGAITGTPPASARLALVNAMAPDKLLYLADFETPLQLATGVTQVVTE